ncbi:hypothetical protein [Sphingopyxis macrogoltabida]|uniref:Spore coat protein U domain-containing protein n=1 Tax=Sphingopyxis macrogoltabida TaxID=33050 RepID=A0AAC9FHD8_SPHMC|nr:hypothetical protein [Sphingopyxis macrogoltabida]ALJ16175.1 hypothetical protein LH19_25135 [Sphingopyxis macrogoltabida]AMU92415.1 hypothetical protein ATM17_25705 [Sphingopyxis macrogoltabida]
MKAMIRIAAFAAAFAGTSAIAQAQNFSESDQELEMVGEAPAACVLRAPSATAGVNASFDPTGPTSGELRIIQMVNPTTAEPLPTSITLALPVVCNASHRIELRSQNGGLLRDQGNARNRQSGSGFGEFVTYRVGLAWAGQQRDVTSEEARNLSIDAFRGAAGDAVLNVSLPGGGGPLVAGRYSDAIIVEFLVAN